jgi:hypothetical protein
VNSQGEVNPCRKGLLVKVFHVEQCDRLSLPFHVEHPTLLTPLYLEKSNGAFTLASSFMLLRVASRGTTSGSQG